MKTILFALLLLPIASYCQKKEMKIDKLTGDTTYFTPYFFISSKGGLVPKQYLQMLVFKGKTLALSFSGMKFGEVSSLNKEDSISFKFKSGAFFSIPYPETTYPDYGYSSGYSAFKQLLLIDQDVIDSLTKEPLVFVRVGATGGSVDFDIPEKGAKAFRDGLLLFKESQ